MEPVVLYLLVPFLGALVVLAEHLRRRGETPWVRHAGKRSLAGLGIGLGAIGLIGAVGVVIVGLTRVKWETLIVDVTILISLFLLTGLMLLTARNAVRVGFTDESGDSVSALSRDSRNSGELQLTAWMLVFVPFLQLGFLGLFVLPPLMFAGVVVWTSRRARESQFLWTLSLAIDNDLPLDDEVDAFALPLWPKNRRKYRELAGRLRDGRSLIDGLELSGVLATPLVAELRAAQSAGTLPQALRLAAAQQTGSLLTNRLDGSIALTAVYLWSILATVFAVTSFVMYYIIPKFKAIFNDFQVELPGWTSLAIRLSSAVFDYFFLVVPLLSLPIIAGLIVTITAVVGWGNLNFPLLMRWFPRRDAPGLLRALAYAVRAERPLTDTIKEMAEHQRRSDFRERLERMQHSLDLGRPISTVLQQEGYVHTVEAHALEAAARVGNLHWALRTLADSMERTNQHRTQLWLEFFKPTAVLAVGCVVAFIVIAFFLPLVKLIGELT